ncbi:hypothetical protein ACFVUH_08310 [Kitasatospora sp. NPDC058032]|uniref:hypothetical protein n=1 Tax=Kitasatospora sp. NPDC058032 TaxID=3346307 RepID=UPI0036DEED3B
MTTVEPATGSAPATLVGGAPAFAGRLLVLEQLGHAPDTLLDRHPEPGAPRSLARLLYRHAERVDTLDDELRRTADQVIKRLSRTRGGDHRDIQPWGLLRALGSDIETVAARYHLAFEQLGLTVHLYRQALAPPADTQRRDAAQARTSAAIEVPAPGAALVSTAATTSAPPHPRTPAR